jgi:pyruvate dehydrogenase E1 component beta subunit
VIDTPIAELDLQGCSWFCYECRPIVENMTFNFSLVGIDQIINMQQMRQMSAGQFLYQWFSWSNSFCGTNNALASF